MTLPLATVNSAQTLPATVRDPVTVALWSLLTRRRQPECWDSTASLAERIGRSVRTVQRALRRLVQAGLVAVRLVRSRTGPGAKSGHRILLQPAPADPSSTTPVASSSTTPMTLSPPELNDTDDAEVSPPPHTPPYRGSEEALERDNNDKTGEQTDPDSSLSSGVLSSQSKDPEPEPSVPPIERRELDWKTSQAFPANPFAQRQIAAFLEAFPLDWVSAALDAAQRTRDRDGTVGTGYVARTLEAFRRAGCAPPPEPVATPAILTLEERAEIIRRIMAE